MTIFQTILANRKLLSWVAIVWTVIMLFGCLTPHDDLPDTLTTWNDKSMHIGIFGLFGLLWLLAGYRPGWVLAAGLLFGGLIEVLQYMLPINRSGDVMDEVADALGTLIGIGLALATKKVLNK